MSIPATIALSSLEGLKTGTGRAETSTGEPVRGFRAMRVLRWRILKVPKPRTSMFFCVCNDSLIASRNASTTRAHFFFEFIAPAVFDIWAVTLSTRSALVIRGPQVRSAAGMGGDRVPNLGALTLMCQEFGPLQRPLERTVSMNSLNSGRASWGPGAASGWY